MINSDSSISIARLLLVAAVSLLVGRQGVVAQTADQKARPFDTFGRITSEDVSARLDNFANGLENEPDAAGYVVCYGPEGEGSGTGRGVLRVTKDYLVNARGIDPERVSTIYGGRYKDPAEVVTELWIVPPGADAPRPKRYKSKLETISGKFAEYRGWDGFPDADGPSLGNVTLAAFADALREQPDSVAYVVAFRLRGSPPGTWRRIAKQEAADLQGYGIQAERVRIIYGGTTRGEKDVDPREAVVQLWITPAKAPPPVKEAAPEPAPKEAVQIGSYDDYLLKYPENERRVFEGFADVLRADERLSLCVIVRPRIGGTIQRAEEGEPQDINLLELVEKWQAELKGKLGIKEGRVMEMKATADEYNEGTIEVWVVPPGAPLPDPYASPGGGT